MEDDCSDVREAWKWLDFICVALKKASCSERNASFKPPLTQLQDERLANLDLMQVFFNACVA